MYVIASLIKKTQIRHQSIKVSLYTLLIITITLLIEYLDESSGSKERSSYESKGKYVQELNIIMMAVFTGLTLPPVIKRRGRPKGHTLTVVGLVPKKKEKV